MALLACCGKAGGRVRRIRRRLIILQVATIARRGRTRKPPVNMASVAGNRDVRAIQRKMRKYTVIEFRREPAIRIH